VTARLGLVLFQFPPWVFFSHKSFEHVLHCQEQLPGFRLAVEFRHKSWFEGDRREETLRFERDHDLVHVVVDEPQGFANSVPAIWEATSGQDAYVRLHGRNAKTWNLKGLASSSERFNYRARAGPRLAVFRVRRHPACTGRLRQARLDSRGSDSYQVSPLTVRGGSRPSGQCAD